LEKPDAEKGKPDLKTRGQFLKHEVMLCSSQKLASAECQEARELWNALMFARSGSALEAARAQLKQAPLRVQMAVMNAIGLLWAQSKDARAEENPFASESQTL